MPGLLFGDPVLYGRVTLPDAKSRRVLGTILTLVCSLPLAAFLGLTAQAQPVFPEFNSRAEAVAALENPDARQRAAGVIYIARTGLAPDGPLLVKRLGDDSPIVRQLAEAGAWQVWSRSGDPETDRLLAAGSNQMSAGQLPQAIATFARVIRRQPAFAEGWNKRATAYFLAGDFKKSLADCDEVIKRNPEHFGALSGYGQIYVRLEEFDKALEYFRRALAVNPNMAGVETNIRVIEDRQREKRRKMI